jgi:hypothetical protein
MVTILLLLTLVRWPDGDEARANETRAKAAVLGSENNSAKFTRYFCRWEVTKASSKDAASAWAGKYEGARSCAYTLAHDHRDGLMDRLRCFAPDPDAAKAVPGTGGQVFLTVEFLAFTELRSGEDELHVNPSWNDARLRLKPFWYKRHDPMPLSIGDFYGDKGMNSPATLFNEYQQGKATLHSQGIVMREGRPLIHVTLSRHYADWSYYFDPQLGYLPVECEHSFISDAVVGRAGKKEVRHLARVMEAKECDGRWFPTRVVCLWLPAKEGDPVSVSELCVQELRLDAEVKPEDFKADLPAGMKIVRDLPEESYVSFRLQRNETVSPGDLARLSKMLDEATRKIDRQKGGQPLMSTAIERADSPWVSRALIGGGAVLLFGAACVTFRRRRLSSRSL